MSASSAVSKGTLHPNFCTCVHKRRPLCARLHNQPTNRPCTQFQEHCVQIEAETPDAWLGLLREPKTGGPLPPTLRTIVVEQFHRSFFGPGGLYWRQYQGDIGKYLPEVEASTFATIISANTGAAVGGNVFVS